LRPGSGDATAVADTPPRARPNPIAGRRGLRALVADADTPTRTALRDALEKSGVSVCSEACDAVAAVEAALRDKPDVCLLDLEMPGGGLAATAQITAELPSTSVVVFAGSESSTDLLDALRVGASGYLPKDMDLSRLAFAIRGVVEGEPALPRRLVARLIEELRDPLSQRLAPLSAQEKAAYLTVRESEVVALLRQGLTTAEIGTRLFIAPVTVRSHVASILKKLGFPDRQAAIRALGER